MALVTKSGNYAGSLAPDAEVEILNITGKGILHQFSGYFPDSGADNKNATVKITIDGVDVINETTWFFSHFQGAATATTMEHKKYALSYASSNFSAFAWLPEYVFTTSLVIKLIAPTSAETSETISTIRTYAQASTEV